MHEGGPTEGHRKDYKSISREIPSWLSSATPDEFLVRLPLRECNFEIFFKSSLLFTE